MPTFLGPSPGRAGKKLARFRAVRSHDHSRSSPSSTHPHVFGFPSAHSASSSAASRRTRMQATKLRWPPWTRRPGRAVVSPTCPRRGTRSSSVGWSDRPEGGTTCGWRSATPEGGWSPRARVVHGDSLFVNWADFPSVAATEDGTLWAHWLRRRSGPGLAYDILLASSPDQGRTWSEPWSPHEDGTPTEHGFVTLVPGPAGVDAVWLDGRGYAPGPDGSEAAMEMSLRYRSSGGADEAPGPEIALDTRTCDCCQTDAVRTADGLVVVYRNRTEDEVRDIYVTRRTPEGWTEGVPVHEDGWVIAGCPVNGPALDASGDRLAVAWFTGAGDVPRVNVAFSDDAGAHFGAPVQVDAGNPAGRVDLRLLDDGTAVVSWLERVGGDGAELRLRRFGPDGPSGEAVIVSTSSSARASGFPRMVEVALESGGGAPGLDRRVRPGGLPCTARERGGTRPMKRTMAILAAFALAPLRLLRRTWSGAVRSEGRGPGSGVRRRRAWTATPSRCLRCGGRSCC